jgi:hypothetical protein
LSSAYANISDLKNLLKDISQQTSGVGTAKIPIENTSEGGEEEEE